MGKVKVKWHRKTVGRPGQAHVFDASGRAVCGIAQLSDEWGVDSSGRLCATCRRKVDPENAPKAPSWRRPL